jgi:hypothetical protein
MASRKCPMCLSSVSIIVVLRGSDDLACAKCSHPLHVASLSSYVATWIGLAAGVLCAWGVARSLAGTMLGWALPVLYGTVAYGVVSAFALAIFGDLVVHPLPVTSPAEDGHTSHSH